MAIIGDALRQAFMPKHEYESLREEDKAWCKLQKLLIVSAMMILCVSVLISAVISLRIVFPEDNLKRPFCGEFRNQRFLVNFTMESGGNGGDEDSEMDLLPGAFVMTDQETVDYYWMVVFMPSAMIFAVSAIYLVSGITVACAAPAKHVCLKVVENNYCASRRGGVRCLSILNATFAIIFGLLALILGSTLLTLGSSCSLPLFWCYEIASWGLVVLYGGTAFFLRSKAAVILDENDFARRNIGLEMLEINPVEVTPQVERRLNEGFKSWMGPSFLSSDEEDESDDYQEVPNLTRTIPSRQRV